MEQSNSAARPTRLGTWRNVGIGALLTGPAVLTAIMSGGAGHGSYITARVLFPFSMLLSQLEGTIGPVAIGVGLLQFPLYGALIGRTVAAKISWIFLLATAHLIAVLVCFSGLLPQFSEERTSAFLPISDAMLVNSNPLRQVAP